MLPVAEFAIITACIFGLYYGAKWIVAAAVGISRKLGFSDVVIGLTVVAIGTSTPELAVTISSLARQQSTLAIANVVGSNIINLGYILGAVAFFAAIPVAQKLAFRDGAVLVVSTLLLAIFFADGQFVWWEGGIFLIILLGYITSLIASQDLVRPIPPFAQLYSQDWLWFIAGSVLIGASANFFVASALNVADFFNMTTWVSGVTIVALGTSIPEIMVSGIAVVDGRPEISAGHLIGSNLFNLLGVMGLVGLLSPGRFVMLEQVTIESSWTLAILMIAVLWMMFTGWKVTRTEGIILFLLALTTWAINFSDLTFAALF